MELFFCFLIKLFVSLWKITNNMENEIWKDIHGYEGIYQASSLGRIKRVLGYNNGNISKVCNGFRKYAFGYIWKYK